jgi:transposase
MDMPMPSGRNQEVEVITGVQRRRRWTPEQKLPWVRRTMEPGMSVSLVAREAGITASQLFQWRKAYTEGSLVAIGANEPVVPASELQEAMKRIKQLEAALGARRWKTTSSRKQSISRNQKSGLRDQSCCPGTTNETGVLNPWRGAQPSCGTA